MTSSLKFSRSLVLAATILLLPISAAAQQDGFPTASPQAMGFSAAKLGRMQKHLQRYVDEQKLAGVVTLVASKGKIVHFEKYGMRDIEAKSRMKKNTIFRLASMTKPLTSVALMMLYEQGRVRLDDPIAKYIPEFAQTKVHAADGKLEAVARPITVKDALMHTTGLTAPGFGNSPVHKMYSEAGLGKAASLDDFTKRLAALPLLHQPGARWSYGFSTDVVARIVEVVAEMPFGQFVEQKILQPLEMRDTGFTVPDEKLDRFAVVYAAQEGKEMKRVEAPLPAFPRGNSGMVSTVPDYLRFAQMLLNGGEFEGVRLLKRETVALMTRSHLPENLIPIGVMDFKFTNHGFGLGFGVVVEPKPGAPPEKNHPGFWWHRGAPPTGSYGWIGAYMTDFWIDPSNEIIGMLFTQSADGMKYPFLQEFRELVYEAFVNGAFRGSASND
jgi:CubicO group peptidase (beta-lactamase class C family)